MWPAGLCSACFLIDPRPPAPGSSLHSQWNGPSHISHQLRIKIMHNRLACSLTFMEAFSYLRLSDKGHLSNDSGPVPNLKVPMNDEGLPSEPQIRHTPHQNTNFLWMMRVSPLNPRLGTHHTKTPRDPLLRRAKRQDGWVWILNQAERAINSFASVSF